MIAGTDPTINDGEQGQRYGQYIIERQVEHNSRFNKDEWWQKVRSVRGSWASEGHAHSPGIFVYALGVMDHINGQIPQCKGNQSVYHSVPRNHYFLLSAAGSR